MTISLIVVMEENRVIGRNNELPWKLSPDLRRFRQLTMGHHLLMGRKTFDSIGRPLPGRMTIVITRNNAFHAAGVTVVPSLEDAIKVARDAGDDEIFVAGGGEIFSQAIPLADRMYITLILAAVEGDVHFPDYDPESWTLIASEGPLTDDKSGLSYTFVTYDRKVAP
ncbi:MAG TPA: dihydrofolate reductase [Thermoanaerobaculia bacterium]|nr:dihydrofolate reductase [Thermoanaerobaculia bacterium]